ncbi:MAG: transglutaminase family protein [Dehalococcoidia bacterium]
MKVHVLWETTYRYTQPVRQLHSEICLLPADRPNGQRLIRGGVTTDPVTTPRPFSDVFGNTVHHLDYLHPVTTLTVRVDAEVKTSPKPESAQRLPPLLERLYLQPTPRAPHDHPAIDALDAAMGAMETDRPLDVAAGVNRYLRDRFTFAVGATQVSATALDFLACGEGVCQDYAHLMIAVLRRRGIASRYVSGYLATATGETATDASHAWVQVLADGHWHGFDPANGEPQDERYVVTAVGRDYDDVPPVRGTYRGHAAEDWTTSIRIAASR